MKNEDVLKKRFGLHATGFDLLCIVGNLILALKHPENKGESAKVTREIGRNMAQLLIDEGLHLPVEVYDEWDAALGLEEKNRPQKHTGEGKIR